MAYCFPPGSWDPTATGGLLVAASGRSWVRKRTVMKARSMLARHPAASKRAYPTPAPAVAVMSENLDPLISTALACKLQQGLSSRSAAPEQPRHVAAVVLPRYRRLIVPVRLLPLPECAGMDKATACLRFANPHFRMKHLVKNNVTNKKARHEGLVKEGVDTDQPQLGAVAPETDGTPHSTGRHAAPRNNGIHLPAELFPVHLVEQLLEVEPLPSRRYGDLPRRTRPDLVPIARNERVKHLARPFPVGFLDPFRKRGYHVRVGAQKHTVQTQVYHPSQKTALYGDNPRAVVRQDKAQAAPRPRLQFMVKTFRVPPRKFRLHPRSPPVHLSPAVCRHWFTNKGSRVPQATATLSDTLAQYPQNVNGFRRCLVPFPAFLVILARRLLTAHWRQSMRVLVTGGAGYLGCHLVRLLLDRGHSVRLFDRFYFGEASVAPFKRSPRCEIVRGDIRDVGKVPELLDGVDAVIHLAGLANDPSCDLSPEMTADINVEGTRNLAVQAQKQGIRRFVQASSCGVYGKGVITELDEESPANPVSLYAESKLDSERLLLAMKSDAFEPVIGRPGTLFGWSNRMRFDLAVNQMVATASRNGRIDVMGGGRQWRPFLHVHDAAKAFLLLLDAPAEKVSGQVFNVGHDGLNLRVNDLAHRIAALFPGIQVSYAKDDEDLRTYRVRFGKMAQVLGFAPRYGIDDGVREVRDALEDPAVDPTDAIYFNVRQMKRLLDTPAAEGGEPVVPRMVQLSPPSLGSEEEAAVIGVFRSGWLAPGAKVEAFESAVARTVGAPYGVAVNSCTAALHLCLEAAGVKPGDEVITSPITWISTANTIYHMGAKLVLADILPDTVNIDPEAVERAVTERTKAIMPVHLAGQPCDRSPRNTASQSSRTPPTPWAPRTKASRSAPSALTRASASIRSKT